MRRVSSQSKMIKVRALRVSGGSWHNGGGAAPTSETGEAGGESPGPSRLKPSAKARAISSSTSSSQSTSASGLRFALPPVVAPLTLGAGVRERPPPPTRFLGLTEAAPGLAGGQHLKRMSTARVSRCVPRWWRAVCRAGGGPGCVKQGRCRRCRCSLAAFRERSRSVSVPRKGECVAVKHPCSPMKGKNSQDKRGGKTISRSVLSGLEVN